MYPNGLLFLSVALLAEQCSIQQAFLYRHLGSRANANEQLLIMVLQS